MKEETSMNVWKESFLIKIRFLTRNDDLRKVAGNWTWPETRPHTVITGAFRHLKKNTGLNLKHIQAGGNNKAVAIYVGRATTLHNLFSYVDTS